MACARVMIASMSFPERAASLARIAWISSTMGSFSRLFNGHVSMSCLGVQIVIGS